MLKVNGGFDQIREDMKAHRSNMLANIKSLKRSTKGRARIDKLEYDSKLYKTTSVLPVKIEGVIINYKLYLAFVKKLKGSKISIFAQSDGLVVQYWVRGSLNQSKGVLRLYDISKYYSEFQHIPEAVIVDGEEA